MTEAPTAREQVIRLTEVTSWLTDRPFFTIEGQLMPLVGEAALCHLHQVTIQWAQDRGLRFDPLITIETFRGERISESDLPDSLDQEFLAYAKDGQFKLERGLFKSHSLGGALLWPDTYRLEPTLPENCWNNPELARTRLGQVADLRRQPQNKVLLRWSLIQQALRSDQPLLCRSGTWHKHMARFYQRHETPEGVHLFVGKLPVDYQFDPKNKGVVLVRPKSNGATLWLTPEFVRNLEQVVNQITLELMDKVLKASRPNP